MGKYFVYCPDCGFEEFKTIEERDKAAAGCIAHHLDECWSDEVTGVKSGVIEQEATQTNLKQRPDELDGDDCDEEGDYWHPDWQRRCDYEMLPITD